MLVKSGWGDATGVKQGKLYVMPAPFLRRTGRHHSIRRETRGLHVLSVARDRWCTKIILCMAQLAGVCDKVATLSGHAERARLMAALTALNVRDCATLAAFNSGDMVRVPPDMTALLAALLQGRRCHRDTGPAVVPLHVSYVQRAGRAGGGGSRLGQGTRQSGRGEGVVAR